MGKHSEPAKKQPAPAAKRAPAPLDGILVIRLIIASLIFAVSLIVKMPGFLTVILLVLSAAVAGYDVVLEAVDAVENRDYFATPIIIVFVAVLSFVLGFRLEGAAVVMLYKIGLALIAYAEERTRQSATELLQYQDQATAERTVVLMEGDDAGATQLGEEISRAASQVLKYVVGFAVLFAVFTPILTSMSFSTAIHRALMIILVSTPLSAVVAIPLSGIVSLAFAGQFGVLLNNAGTLEKLSAVKTAIFDKVGVFSDENPKLLSVQSDVLDTKTFMHFVAHAAYYSEQPFAKAITAAFDQEYRLDLINDFVDIPGCGVDLTIGGAHVTLGTRELYAGRGEAVPYEPSSENLIYYLMVSDKYIGRVEITDKIHEDSTRLMASLKKEGVYKCVLLSEEGKEESERLGLSLDADEVYAECDMDKKLRLIQNLSSGHEQDVAYIYSSGIESHSSAGIDIRVSQKSKYADAMALPEYLGNLPEAFRLGRRMCQIIMENAVLAVIVKAILIYLSIIGRANLWFVIFIDMIAAQATILNTIRVTQAPLIRLPSLNDQEDSEEQ